MAKLLIKTSLVLLALLAVYYQNVYETKTDAF